jgi:hypothetical protein
MERGLEAYAAGEQGRKLERMPRDGRWTYVCEHWRADMDEEDNRIA